MKFAAADKMAPKCCFCSKSASVMKQCVRCRVNFYCSRECQIEDWPRHRNDCIEKTSSDTIPNTTKNSVSGTVATKTPVIDFAKAFKDLRESTKQPDTLEATSTASNDTKPRRTIYVKIKGEKFQVDVPIGMKGSAAMECIAKKCRMDSTKLKLIHKGKLVTKENIENFLMDDTLFLAIGEKLECEDGLETGDIDVIMKQLSVERNCAIKALRETSGDVVDAILLISNK